MDQYTLGIFELVFMEVIVDSGMGSDHRHGSVRRVYGRRELKELKAMNDASKIRVPARMFRYTIIFTIVKNNWVSGCRQATNYRRHRQDIPYHTSSPLYVYSPSVKQSR